MFTHLDPGVSGRTSLDCAHLAARQSILVESGLVVSLDGSSFVLEAEDLSNRSGQAAVALHWDAEDTFEVALENRPGCLDSAVHS
jgi:hypothetical protein